MRARHTAVPSSAVVPAPRHGNPERGEVNIRCEP
jgi:hypothetical protein